MASPLPIWRSIRHCRRSLLTQAAQQQPARPRTSARLLSASSSASASSPPLPPSTDPPSSSQAHAPTRKQKKPLTPAQQAFLSSALRVNQAGELAATLIYTAQAPPVVRREPHLRPLMQHMYDQEAGHLDTFNALLAKHRVRPTALYPVWSALATGLGWTTGVMGREAAMACTEAVETEIGGHYNAQIRELLEMVAGWEREGYDVGEEFTELIGTLRRIRDEELEHLDHAVEHDAKKAEPYWLLTGVIRAGCRGAIWVSERV
ncbi:5-demethoxyubiquinone hydroxylase, mitochondrial [Madurella mycetomatis]|uniref:5-demethoxyubiquinone hydroxylase, mitochondrial n=1 Tax=Madurella mycetomatis TaxID=100816 RepID=A0A175WEM1_9PEZI|nr:5-demethoxyubiquinone hydroxylase, mitochondrial [Madurella mycetomatis]